MCVFIITNLHLVDATVSFKQQTYSVNENGGNVQPVLVLSNPSSTDIILEVFNTDGSGTGEPLAILHVIIIVQWKM